MPLLSHHSNREVTMRRFAKLVLICTGLALFQTNASAGLLTGFEWWEKHVLDKFEFMSASYIDCDGVLFMLHQDKAYQERYFIETNSNLEFELVNYEKILFSVWELYVRTGLGRQNDIVIFDPRDSRYGLIPGLEFRPKRVNLKLGLEHFCYHHIDREAEATAYWNKPFFDISSKNSRLGSYRKRLVQEEKWDLAARLAWRFRLAYYWETLFGLFDEALINGGQDYRWEIVGQGRYAFYKRLSWIVGTSALVRYNIVRETGNVNQTYLVGMESHFRRGKGGMMLFAYYNLFDDFAIRDRNKLLETGFRFYL